MYAKFNLFLINKVLICKYLCNIWYLFPYNMFRGWFWLKILNGNVFLELVMKLNTWPRYIFMCILFGLFLYIETHASDINQSKHHKILSSTWIEKMNFNVSEWRVNERQKYIENSSSSHSKLSFPFSLCVCVWVYLILSCIIFIMY